MRRKRLFSDVELLEEFNKGNENCFSQFFESFYPSLCMHAFRIMQDQAVAEEIAEDTFVKVWERQNVFSSFNSLKSYLYNTNKHACIDWLRKQQRRQISGEELISQSGITEQSVMETMVHAEVLRELISAIDTLPAKCQAIIKMLFLEGKEINQVAEEMKVSGGTVRTQKARGLFLLRQKLSAIKIFFVLF